MRNLQGKILEIKTSVDGLSVKAANLQNDYTQLSQTVDGLELTVVKDGEVRTAFAADATSVTISSGIIGFTSNSITIDSSNFKLDANGNVTATGIFRSNNGIIGAGRNESLVTSGSFELYRTLPNGQSTLSAQLFSEGTNSAMSRLRMFGAEGVEMVTMWTDFDGSHLYLRNGTGHNAISFNGGTGGAEFEGDVDVQGPVGLGVSTTVNCQTLHAWGSKNRIVPSSLGNIKMAAFETPEPSFADSGSGKLDKNGLCLIELDPLYSDTLEQSKTLRWIVTPTSQGEAWIEKRDGCAMVHGTAGLDFDWMCIGAQRGYGEVYAERCYDNSPIKRAEAEDLLDWAEISDTAERQELDALIEAWDPFFEIPEKGGCVG